MSYDEKLDLILAEIASIKAQLAAPAPVVQPQTGGLYAFARPALRDATRWANRKMASPDAAEAIERALHGVSWAGSYLADSAYEEAWAEIEALKSGDAKLIASYQTLDPEFAGVALLSGLIAPVKHDAITFGETAKKRLSYAGATVQSFLDDQFRVTGGPGIA